MGDITEYTRLHITPLSAELLPSIIPKSMNARNITFHTIQTFDKPYGFVELPTMDATKLKTKLNGSILKGQKIKIETANPKHVFVPEEPQPEKLKREKTKKRKRNEIPGAEIGERSVKRGWAQPGITDDTKNKKNKRDKKVKSKYSTGKECLFKTVLPANAAATTKPEKDKKPRKGKGKETIIHEFEKTTKYPAFLRDPTTNLKKNGARGFVEGKGWVDEDGELIEPVAKLRRQPERKAAPRDENTGGASKQKVVPNEAAQAVVEEDTSSSGTSSEGSDSEDDPGTAPKVRDTVAAKAGTPVSSTSSDESASSDAESSTSASEDEPLPDPPSTLSTPIKSSRPASSSGLTIKIPDSAPTSTPISGEVHPLEALYKRPKANSQTPKPATSTFSFFGADNDIDDEEAEVQDTVPLTPFTQRDFEYRGLRSAAPTPDTAHGNKRFLWPTDNGDEKEEGRSSPIRKDVQGKEKGGKAKEEPKEGESDFQKWFYENRGDTSRAWKKRRREVAKEKRQRENRKRADRG